MGMKASAVLLASVADRYRRPISHLLKTEKLQQLPVMRHIRPSKNCSLLIKHSNAMNNWSQADAGNVILWKNLLFFIRMYSLAPILYFFRVRSMEVGSSRTQISPWGNGKMAETHAGATPSFSSVPQKETTLVRPMGKTWYFLLRDTFMSSNWCLVWNSQKEA